MYTEINEMFTPSIVKVQSDNKNHSRIVLEPLEPGYGHTLGNALRRILLASMPGWAVTEVSIEGVPHEYCVIENIEEDVVQIILNLKQLAIKIVAGTPISRVTTGYIRTICQQLYQSGPSKPKTLSNQVYFA